ncbi:MAG TPA: hypothetical protein QGF05_12980, partial [Dehalococcoidia bacterium]|nr:hypothetical protein [Dehalococcoidia bacterium]
MVQIRLFFDISGTPQRLGGEAAPGRDLHQLERETAAAREPAQPTPHRILVARSDAERLSEDELDGFHVVTPRGHVAMIGKEIPDRVVRSVNDDVGFELRGHGDALH